MPVPPMLGPKRSLLERWARFTHRRRGTVIVSWIVFLVALVFALTRFGGEFSTEFSLPGSESQRARDLLEERFPARAGGDASIVFEAPAGIDAARPAVEAALGELAALPNVAEIESPFESPGFISEDGTIARAVIHFDLSLRDIPRSSAEAVMSIADGNSTRDLTVVAGGNVIEHNEQPEIGSELYGLVAAVFILMIAFGSVVAMGLPIGAALFGLGAGFATLGILSRWFGFPDFSTQFAAMIGIGVGIDYSLLVVTRFREGLHAGRNVEDSVVIAVTTAGRAVIFAGLVVALAFMGLFVMGLPFVAMLGTAGAIVVVLAVVVAVTITPAALSLVGHRIDSLKIPFLHQTEGIDETSIWFRLSRAIQARPLLYAAGSTTVLLVLAIPILSMDLGFTDAGNGSADLQSRRSYDLLAKGFGPGFNGPLVIVADFAEGGQETIPAVQEAVAAAPGVARVFPPVMNPAGDTAVITVMPTTKPQDDATTDLVKSLRGEVLDAVATNGAQYWVSGATAGNIDAATRIGQRMPLLFAGVIGVSFILLTAVFRSVVVAVKAAIMNLLSIGAAYGVIVAIFQWGWFAGIVGVDKGPVEVFLPMMMFAILFGLSMDYEVFLISRIREEYLRTGNTETAVANGLTATARVITAAAAIMVTVFLSFVLGPDRIIKEFGIGLATAIFVDATIVRLFLVPSTMELLREANWWMPRWLDRILPNLHIEGPSEHGPVTLPAAGGK
ncbi:MAG: MMPL family transporter [Dehalococcoidia bacterium]|nr:MMPL family transporter [Dehalococcoidia bacterium]